MQSSALVQTRLVAAQQKIAVRPARRMTAQCAARSAVSEESRRSTLALLASVFAAATLSMGSAQAIELPAQAIIKGGSSSEASSSGYSMEGTKKRGLSPGKKAAAMAKAKAAALTKQAKSIVS
ncbi:hypothetical protein WJX72_001862 [[Myrmecia] bisecta]|uniref:Antifreeze protein n=1 Tax=[Myrmecia] bisecta TaxID=41462 RepID=A0AAW1PSF2_9CHLO